MKTILIVEDNPRSKEMLVKMIKGLRKDVNIETASSQEEAAALVMKNSIDLFMLDIILNTSNPGDVSGLQFAEYIRTMPKYKYTPIIFITALEDPELHAYSDLHCYSYVEKPFDVKKVSEVISEALEFPGERKESNSVFFRKDGILYKKEISEIIYIENNRSGQTVHCTNGNIKLPYKPSKAILKELGSDRFIQCSRYIIVNKDFIDQIDIVNRYIQLKGIKEQIEVGVAFKNRFLKDLVVE